MSLADLYDTTLTSNGPYFLQLSSDTEGGLNQPPTEFNLASPDDYTLAYIDPNNLEGSVTIGWRHQKILMTNPYLIPLF